MTSVPRPQVAVLDDYQNVALEMADWSPVSSRADITVFNDHIFDPDELVTRLAPFDVIMVMRERTPLPRSIIERLPRLKMIASTGPFNAAIDMAAAEDHGIYVGTTGGSVASTVELTWALILAGARDLVAESVSVRTGGWQVSVGTELSGRVLGILGLGRIGARVARIGEAFGMRVIAWSQNLTAQAAAELGAEYVAKEELFGRSDVLTIHMKLSERSTGLVGAPELALMKSTALLVNTSRGPIVEEAALVEALRTRTIAAAALDVFDIEPLPAQHPLRALTNVIATPHIGYVADRPYRIFYRDAVGAISEWLDRQAS
ncbi:hydroxyacid dehydrogenase [Mycolicibacterium litorale]|nr:hydroxyacid dehydrogenase [Mycolicibacterium litorale]